MIQMQSIQRKRIEVFFLALSLGTIGIIYYRNLSTLSRMRYTAQSNQNLLKKIKDSADIIKFANYYLNKQFDIWFAETNKKYNIQNVKLYALTDGKPQFQRIFGSIVSAKRKLIVRYTEIGCNSCSDSTIRSINKNEALRKMFDIIYLVDFSNYDAYLKWRKVAEISDPVYWIEKGSLPFGLEESNDSYIYTVDEFSRPGNFFVPNSRLPYYINAYLEHICQNT